MLKVNNGATPKDVARYILDELGVSKPYVLDFESNDQIYLFDNGEAERVACGSELYERIQEIETRSNVKVYAVTHDNLDIIGETYSLLCVSPYPEDWVGMLRGRPVPTCIVYAYVWNVAHDVCSEFGYIALTICDGILRRVG